MTSQISLRHKAGWFDVHIFWNDYHNRFSNTYLLNKKKKRKNSPCDENFKIYSLNFPMYCTAALSLFIMLYVVSLVLTYNWKFVPLTIILQFLLSPNPSPLIVTSPVPISMSFIFFKIAHISEIIQHFYFSLWLISLAIMPSRSIHGVANGRIFYFFYDWIIFYCINIPYIHGWALKLLPCLGYYK